MPAAKPLCFSYLRFSSPQQSHGDSIRRQVELRDAWIAKTGAILDTSLSLRDEGVSGYTGAHRKNPDRNALALFLQQVERGRIPKGSFLLVENLDRLSREHIRPALTLLLNLIEAGVRVVQLTPAEKVFDEDVEPMDLMMAIMELSRGHSESKLKSERIGKGWRSVKKAARDNGTVATKNIPGWLRVDGGTIVPVPDRVQVVRRMYQMARDGHSISTICRTFNDEAVPTFGRSEVWNPSTVGRILTGRETTGEFQPGKMAWVEKRRGKKVIQVWSRVPDGNAIPGYYPTIIPEPEWWVVRQSLKQRDTGGRRPTRDAWNPFAGLLRDARDNGAPVYLLHQGSRRSAAYASSLAVKGRSGAKFTSFAAEAFVTEVLRHLREVDPRDILDGTNPAGEAVAVIQGRRSEVERRVADLRSELESGGGEVRAAVQALRTLEADLDTLTEELAHAQAAAATPLGDAWADCKTVLDALAKAPDPDEAHVRVRGAVRRVVDEIWVLFVALPGRVRAAVVQVYFTGGGQRHYLIRRKPSTANQHNPGRPAVAESGSFAAANSKLDLRNKTHVGWLTSAIAAVDPALPFDQFVVAVAVGVILPKGDKAAALAGELNDLFTTAAKRKPSKKRKAARS